MQSSFKSSCFIAGLMLCGSIAFGAPMNFAGIAARDAAAQISDKYGVSFVFRGSVDINRPVSFSLDDANGQGARMQAVITLANALDADYQKTYVVSKADKNADIVLPKIDTNADVVFPSLTVTAAEAVQRIAGVDSAISQYYGTAGETVTLSATTLGATEAAREVAQQTHTRWKVFFAITPAAQGRTRGRVVGHTPTGEPIIQDPYVYYHSTPEEAPPALPATNGPAMASSQTNRQQGGLGYGQQMPYGFYSTPYNYPYGFNPYAGNNPYAQNVYPGGNNSYGPVSAGSGLEIGGGGNGYGAPIVFGGGF